MRTKILATLLGLLAFNAHAQLAGLGNPEVQKYVRCYGQFVRSQVSFSDPRISLIAAGTLSGTDACMQLLNEANLQDDNELKKVDGNYDERAMLILKTFNDLHRSWFANVDLRGQLLYYPSSDINDNGEMAYYYTRALFDSDHDYTSILKGNKTIQAIRYSEHERPYRHLVQVYQTSDFGERRLPAPLAIGRSDCVERPGSICSNEWNFDDIPFNQLGLLVGFKERESFQSNDLFVYQGVDKEIYDTPGGGLIGSFAFFAINRNSGINDFGDGGLHVNRRWSKAIFEDVLCRPIPVVRIRDATAYVTQDVDLPFIKGEACMGCHTSLDPMARTTRNISLTLTGTRNQASDDAALSRAAVFRIEPTTQENEQEAADHWYWPRSIPNYRFIPPRGILYFRNIDGELVENNVTGVQQLADEILKQPDIYACAAKRYLYFLTGIDTVLYDKGKLLKPKFDELQQKHQEFVYELGRDLQQHRDPKKIIKAIVDSPYYLNPNKK